MLKDDYGNIELSDEITCPYCGNEFMDSWEYIPKNDGNEASWDQECDCGKTFHVHFDHFNQNNGFTCSKICKSHNYKWDGKRTYNGLTGDHWISTTANCYYCSKCGDLQFRNTKPDGTEYTKKEVSEWKKKRPKERFKQNHPEMQKSTGEKKVEIRADKTWIYIDTDSPEGNKDLFHAINRLLSKKGFKILIQDNYKSGGQFSSLQRWNRDLNRGWLWCAADFSRNLLKYEFFQNKYLEKGRSCGRYGFEKYGLMDLKMKTEFRSVRKAIIDYVNKKCEVITKPIEILDWHGNVQDPKGIDKLFPGKIIRENSGEWNDKGQGKDQTGVQLQNGDFRSYYDSHGRLISGWMYDRGGSYKFMVHNDRTFSLVSCRECFIPDSETKRYIRPKNSESRLKSLLQENIESQDFEKCVILKKEIDRIGEIK